jgi:PBP1b-binding outer membrane lipoprotein LpoB
MRINRIVPVLIAALVFSACTTLGGGESGDWSAEDVQTVCNSLINSCLVSPQVNQLIAQKGRLPVILVGSFRNDSDEHIETSIISNTMAVAIFNSGKAKFVAGGSTREELRAERQEQLANASEESAKALGNETGADFLLTGKVWTIVDRTSRTYFVSAELTDIETTDLLWWDQNSEIKKVIKRPAVKL